MPNKYNYNIDPDISKSETLPSSFYKDPNVFEDIKSKIFLKSWQWIGDTDLVPEKNYVYPLTVLNKYLSEPVIISRTDDNDIICLCCFLFSVFFSVGTRPSYGGSGVFVTQGLGPCRHVLGNGRNLLWSRGWAGQPARHLTMYAFILLMVSSDSGAAGYG